MGLSSYCQPATRPRLRIMRTSFNASRRSWTANRCAIALELSARHHLDTFVIDCDHALEAQPQFRESTPIEQRDTRRARTGQVELAPHLQTGWKGIQQPRSCPPKIPDHLWWGVLHRPV